MFCTLTIEGIECPEDDLGSALPIDDTWSFSANKPHLIDTSCHPSPESQQVWAKWTAPESGLYTFRGYARSYSYGLPYERELSVAIIDDSCRGAELACGEPAFGSEVSLELITDQSVVVVLSVELGQGEGTLVDLEIAEADE